MNRDCGERERQTEHGGPMGISVELQWQIYNLLLGFEKIYYPLLAAIGVPVNLVAIVILSRGKSGLSKSITHYLVAMATGDLMVIVFDLMLRHIPIVFKDGFVFLESIRLCNIHAVLVYAVTDCSVWFTVTFTFDRFVAICCPKLQGQYCSERTAAVVLGTVTALSVLKNIFWYLMLTGQYVLVNQPWFCLIRKHAVRSPSWMAIEFTYYLLTPCVPCVLILLFNIFTVSHIVVSSRARKRLRAHGSGESPKDQEMESRRKSIILLILISANFSLLWLLLMFYSIWIRMWWLEYLSFYLPFFLPRLGFMLQLLSCCTNTVIYAVTQRKFREQLKIAMKHPFTPIVKLIHK